LGTGEVTKKLSVSAHKFSAEARKKIEAKGGTCEVIAPRVLAAKFSAVNKAEAAK
jgi:large subunit ribosomal protein L15